MALRNWHPGQLLVLWVGGVLLWVWFYWREGQILLGNPTLMELPMVLRGAVFFGTPLALLVLTWVWFGARPARRRDEGNGT
jgi:hypothetical protein